MRCRQARQAHSGAAYATSMIAGALVPLPLMRGSRRRNDRSSRPSSAALQYLTTMQSKRKYRLNAEAIAAIRQVQKAVREKFAGDPYFDDVLAFDPESDEPNPSAEAKIRERMGDVAERMGLARTWPMQSARRGSSLPMRASTCSTMTSSPPGTKPSKNTTGRQSGRSEAMLSATSPRRHLGHWPKPDSGQYCI